MRFSLKVKAAAAITLLFLGMMALIASVQTRFIRADLMEEVTGEQAALVARVADELDQRLHTNLQALTLEALAIPPEILAQPQEFQSYLARQPAMLLLFDALLIISPTGEVLADAPQGCRPRRHQGGRPGLLQAQHRHTQTGDIRAFPRARDPVPGRHHDRADSGQGRPAVRFPGRNA